MARGNFMPPGWDDDSFPPSRPIEVEGGLVARSARGGIGREWWSRRFIAVLESFALGTRLTRGRSYARKGQVISLDVEAGVVTASVQGSRVTPYRVRIGLPVFTELTWAKAEVALAEQAIFAARLLAGEFPPELEPVFASIGAPLFPSRLADLTMSCSCPDHAVPCKHLAATFYLLAERFDDHPFLILRWRGRDREALLARLRELRGDLPDTPTDETHWAPEEPGFVVGAASALVTTATAGGAREASPSASMTGTESTFWTGGVLPPPPPRPDLPVDLLLRQLPTPAPTLGGRRLVAHLEPLYAQLAEGGEPLVGPSD